MCMWAYVYNFFSWGKQSLFGPQPLLRTCSCVGTMTWWSDLVICGYTCILLLIFVPQVLKIHTGGTICLQGWIITMIVIYRFLIRSMGMRVGLRVIESLRWKDRNRNFNCVRWWLSDARYIFSRRYIKPSSVRETYIVLAISSSPCE